MGLGQVAYFRYSDGYSCIFSILLPSIVKWLSANTVLCSIGVASSTTVCVGGGGGGEGGWGCESSSFYMVSWSERVTECSTGTGTRKDGFWDFFHVHVRERELFSPMYLIKITSTATDSQFYAWKRQYREIFGPQLNICVLITNVQT